MTRVHVPATPLFEVFSVTVRTDYVVDHPLKVCGFIRVTCGGDGLSFDVYNKSMENPDIVSSDSVLSISNESCGAISLFGSLKVEMDLKVVGADNPRELAKGTFTLSYDLCGPAEELLYVNRVSGAFGFATMHCTVFRYAVEANLEIQYEIRKFDSSNAETDSLPAASNIFGKIVARYADNYRYKVISEDKDYVGNENDKQALSNIILFSKSKNESIQVEPGSDIPLSRSYVCVPAYSSIVIEAELCDFDSNDKLASGRVECCCGNLAIHRKNLRGQNGTLIVYIFWSNAYSELIPLVKLPLPEKKNLESGSEEDDEEEYDTQEDEQELTKCVEQNQVLKLLSYLYSSKVLGICRKICASTLIGFDLVEMFSFSFRNKHGGKVDLCNLYGSIEVIDIHGRFSVFYRKTGDLSRSLVWPRYSILSGPFYIVMDLYDGDDLKLSDVEVNWSGVEVRTSRMSWPNLRLSSILPGENGYAVANYIIFEHALSGMVKIFVEGNNLQNVYGRIFAYYDDYSYSTPYEVETYMISLFNESSETPLQVPPNGSELPLSRSHLCVPVYSNVVIDCALYATSLDTGAPMFSGCIAKVKAVDHSMFLKVMEYKHGEGGGICESNKGNFNVEIVVDYVRV